MQLEIILRTHDQGSLHNRNVDYPKKEIVRRCAQSLFDATPENVKLTIIDDHSSDDTVNFLQNIGDVRKLKGTGNNTSLACAFDQAASSIADIVFLVEDDYLFQPHAIEEMLSTWEHFVKMSGCRDICLSPVDCPLNYTARDGSHCGIMAGINRPWRTNTHTGGTFMTTPKVLNKYWGAFDDLIKNWPNVDEDATWNKIWAQHVPLFTPLVPLAYHLCVKHPYYPFDELWRTFK